jgi:homoserine O-acetyltransferase
LDTTGSGSRDVSSQRPIDIQENIRARYKQIGRGIAGDPAIANLWGRRTIPADSVREHNTRGTLSYAQFKPSDRTTNVFINLRDNSATHDKEPFVPIAKVIEGMDVVDALYSGYGETSGGGIRAGKQDPLFTGGNDFLKREFPLLDYIIKATIER